MAQKDNRAERRTQNAERRTRMYMLKRFVASGCLVVATIWSLPGITESFQGVMPPPELGENLTEYRTRQQLLDQAVREATGERSNPQIKIYRKNADGIPDYEHPELASQASNDDTSSIRKITSARASSGRAVKTLNYDYTGPKYIKLRRGERYAITVRDGDDVVWPIAKVEVSNSTFPAEINAEHQVVIHAVPNAGDNSLANLKITLDDEHKRELKFILSIKETGASIDYDAFVRVAHKSPLNADGTGRGTTNMTLSAKSRNSRRTVNTDGVVTAPNTSLKPDGSSSSTNDALEIRTIKSTSGSEKEAVASSTSSNTENTFTRPMDVPKVTAMHGLGFEFLKSLGITVLGQRPVDTEALAMVQSSVYDAAISVHAKEAEAVLVQGTKQIEAKAINDATAKDINAKDLNAQSFKKPNAK